MAVEEIAQVKDAHELDEAAGDHDKQAGHHEQQRPAIARSPELLDRSLPTAVHEHWLGSPVLQRDRLAQDGVWGKGIRADAESSQPGAFRKHSSRHEHGVVAGQDPLRETDRLINALPRAAPVREDDGHHAAGGSTMAQGQQVQLADVVDGLQVLQPHIVLDCSTHGPVEEIHLAATVRNPEGA